MGLEKTFYLSATDFVRVLGTADTTIRTFNTIIEVQSFECVARSTKTALWAGSDVDTGC